MPRKNNDAIFWNRAARKYATDRIKDMPGYERTIERTCQLLRSSDRALELGCGTGTTALRLAEHVKHLLATDVSSEMIAIGREKAALQACANIEFANVGADDLVAPDSSFDVIMAFNVLHLIDDRTSALKHVHRLLKPEGRFITKTPCLSEMNPLIRYVVPLAQLVGKAPHVSFFTADKIAKEIEAAGFTIIEQARHGSGRKDPRIYLVAQKLVTA